jgi:hypothetical protein
VTGLITGDLPMAKQDPAWLTQINNDGNWTVQTPIGAAGGLSKEDLRAATDPWRRGIALCYGTGIAGDAIAQMGPITARQLVSDGGDSGPPILQLGGPGGCGLLRATMQFASTWNGVAFGSGADVTYTGSYQSIATQIIANFLLRNPVAMDSTLITDAGGKTMTYFGYDLTSAGQRLQELTVLPGGPDIFFKPYFADSSHLRFKVLVGTPSLATTGNQVILDHPGSIVSLLTNENAVNESTTTYVKGNGMEYSTLWAKASDATLPNNGWPLLEYVDISQTAQILQPILNDRATSLQALNGRPVDIWAATMVMDDIDSPFGSYDPGGQVIYNVRDHCWIPNGQYTQRLIGFQSGPTVGTYTHLLQNNGTVVP